VTSVNIIKIVVLMLIVALALVNGALSPRLFNIFLLQQLWYPSVLPQGFQLLLAISGLVLSLLYLMVSAIPAALFERVLGQAQSSVTSRLIWLATLAALTVPNLPAIRTWLNLLI
jgi:hypothetical protein